MRRQATPPQRTESLHKVSLSLSVRSLSPWARARLRTTRIIHQLANAWSGLRKRFRMALYASNTQNNAETENGADEHEQRPPLPTDSTHAWE
jgi:hypothetical protein